MGFLTNDNIQITCAIFFGLLVYCSFPSPQLTEAAPTTDPKEVETLRVIATKMKISKWDFSLDPCNNDDPNWYTLSDTDGPMGVMCSCVFDRNTTCHVVKLIVLYEELQGIVPPELANLTYLQSLDLRYNFLSGSIPASLGSLQRLEYLSLGQNRLTGEVPKEFGNLTKLISLSVDTNRLSGTLPAQLGNLANLEEFYIRSNQFSGTIPTTFSNLKQLKIFRASSNNFTGKLPDVIGNWTRLEDLRLEGTSFEGPIPSTLSNLTKLITLIICDLPNGVTSLPFLPNLKNLQKLFLRNNNISGQIPENIGELDKLQIL